MHPKVYLVEVDSSVSCSPTILLNETKLRYRTMNLKMFEKCVRLIELGAVYRLDLKCFFLVHPESALLVYVRLHLLRSN